MKKMLLMVLLLSGLIFAAASGNQENIKEALGELEQTSKSVMLLSSIIQGAVAVVFLVLAALIYMKKLKGVQEKSMFWIILLIIIGAIGLLLLLGAVLGLIMYFMAGMMIDSMVGPAYQ